MHRALARAALSTVGLLALCQSSHAIVLNPNETVRVDCCAGSPSVTYSGTGPITDLNFNFSWSSTLEWQQNTWVYLQLFDTGGNLLTSEFFNQGSPNGFTNAVSSGFFNTGFSSNDLAPYLLVTSVDATFDFTGALLVPRGPNLSVGFRGALDDYKEPIAVAFSPYPTPFIPPLSAPEPSTWAMLLIGFAGIGFAAYRRSKRVASS